MADPAFGFEKPEHSPGFILWQTMVIWQRLIKKALDPYNIPHAQFVILANVLWFEGMKQKPTQILIVRSTKLDKMTVSKSLKKLVTEGLIKRMEHKSDTRAKSVQLTAKGKAMASKLVPIIERVDEEFFALVGSKNQQSLVRILGELVSKITY
jgi:DNA-binding MarR family transcriptional regulator